jgi:hypothetical protein
MTLRYNNIEETSMQIRRSEMKKTICGLTITLALLVMVTGTVFAEEVTPPLTGIVQSVELETDPETSVITAVVVTLVDELGVKQVVRISLKTAIDLGLVDLTQAVVYIPEEGLEVKIELSDIIEETDDGAEDSPQHPVAEALSDFFSTLLGVNYGILMTYHEDGVGFGVIAQALWMTKSLEGDTELFQVILDAKKSGDYSLVTLPDGSTPTNWGQFRKAVYGDKEKAKDNLGYIKSGKAEDDLATDTEMESGKPDKGNKDKGKGKDKDD